MYAGLNIFIKNYWGKWMLKKIYKIISFVVVVFIIIIICGLIIEKSFSFLLKEILVYKVNNNMDSLKQLINDINSYESEINKVIKFEDTEDSEYLRELFINLDLDEIVICVDDDKISKCKDIYVLFIVKRTKLLLLSDLNYGFYYTNQNQSIRLFNIMPSEEGENFWLGFHYKYHTEQFKDNWWYYELKYIKS